MDNALDFIPGAHMAVQNHLQIQVQGVYLVLLLTFTGTRQTHGAQIPGQAKHSYTQNKINILKVCFLDEVFPHKALTDTKL